MQMLQTWLSLKDYEFKSILTYLNVHEADNAYWNDILDKHERVPVY